MGVIIPRVVTEESASGAPVIDGSLTINKGKNYLKRTPSSGGNQRTWTWSAWVKRDAINDATHQTFFSAGDGSRRTNFMFDNTGYTPPGTIQINYQAGQGSGPYSTKARRDFSGFYHIVVAFDTTQGTAANRIKCWVNGVEDVLGTNSFPNQNTEWDVNSAKLHTIGMNCELAEPFGGRYSNFHFIDGQALDATYFGFTDPLTGTWRPKKFSGNYNLMVDDATGGKPILLTSGGPYGGSSTTGSVDTTDSAKANLVIALPLQDDTTDVSNLVRGSGSAISVTAVDAKYTSAYSKYYGAAGDFTDSTDKFSMQVSNSGGAFDLGTGNCCIEWWAYYPSTVSNNGYIFRSDTTNGDECYAYAHSNGTVAVKFAGFTWDAWPGSGGNHDDWSNSVWNHFCIERNGSTWTAYMNGVPMRTTGNGVDANPGDTMGIGNYNNSNLNYYAKCYLQDFRWYTASKYGGNAFTVPSLGINSFYLPMDGNSPIGQDKSGIINVNNGTDWSFTGTLVNTQRGTNNGSIDGLFNGSLNSSSDDNYVQCDNNSSNPSDGSYTFPGSGVPFTSLEVAAIKWGGDVKVNDVNINAKLSSSWADPDWVDITSLITSPLTKLTYQGNGSQKSAIFGVRIDGVVLRDGTNWTPVKLGGNIIPKATGALPILNTVSGGNVATVGVRTDAYAANLKLALPCTGSKDDVSNQVNSGSATKAITVNTAGSASSKQSQFYGGSWYFPGTNGNNLQTAVSSEFTLGTGSFTLELWTYTPTGASGGDGWFDLGNGTHNHSMIPFYNTNTNMNLYASTDGTGWNLASGKDYGPIQFDKWVHYALVRNGNDWTGYENGIAKFAFNSSATPYQNTNQFTIGSCQNVQSAEGWMNDFRFYNIAKYTSNFTPASTNPDIFPETPSGVVYGSKLTKGTSGSVTFDGTGDYLSLADSADFDLAGNDFTIEAFVYHSDTDYVSYEGIVGQWVDSSGTARTWILETVGAGATSDLEFYYYDTSDNFVGPVQGGILSKNRWHHVAACRSGNTIRLFIDGVMYGSGTSISVDIKNATNNLTIGGQVSGASGYWNGFISNVRVINNTALYPANFTPPSSPLTNVTNTKLLCCQSNTSAAAVTVGPSSPNNGTVWSTRSYWTGTSGDGTLTNASSYPLTAAFDGNLNTTFGMSYAGGMIWTPPSPISFSSSVEVYIDNSIGVGIQGYVATISGTQESQVDLTLSDAWGTIKSGSGTLDKLQIVRGTGSGNNNLWVTALRVDGVILLDGATAIVPTGNVAASAFNPFDTDIDTVMGKPTGYCTLNPLWSNSTQTNGNNPPLFKEGNLAADYQAGTPSGNYFKSAVGTIGVDSTKGGKWYFETTAGGGNYCQIGMVRDDYQWEVGKSGWGISGSARGLAYQSDGGFQINAGSIQGSLKTWTTYGQMASFLIDFDNKKVNAWVDGVDVGYTVDITSYLSDLSPIWYPAISVGDWSSLTNDETMYVNFGQKPFKFIPPEGYQPISAANSPSPGMTRPDQYYGTTLYNGNSATHPVDLGFKPDMVMIKSYHDNNGSWNVLDTVRGASYRLRTEDTTAQVNDTGNFVSFNHNGITVQGSANGWNGLGDKFAVYTWKAGGNKGTFNKDGEGFSTAAAAGLSAGDTTITGASVNTQSGFSIIKYTGPNDTNNHTVAHGLTQAPDCIIAKNLDTTYNWDIYNSGMADDKYMIFTDAAVRSQGFNGRPTSTVINTEHDYSTNENQAYIAYCWHNLEGVQKFGSYAGNSNASGTYVDVGFRPALVWIKANNTNSTWVVYDNARSTYNPIEKRLRLDYVNKQQDSSSYAIDFLSSGFKLRTTDGDTNGGQTYYYFAWSSEPFHNLYGAQGTAW